MEMELPCFVFQAKGWQLYADWKNRQRIKPGRPEGLPRTAAITQKPALKKRGIMSCAVILRVFQTRSLIRQRHPKPIHRTSDGQPAKHVGNFREKPEM
ncbi:hypothetical protein IAI51_01405 [Pseudomonas sp. N40(2020)]|uniref:hypothetical protein n=1 Tax=Pseudomonas sp. N40(2020) TaxID=2767798 RepID=UPI0016574434|nr:hypothetical protein [Pseudomonas sp. N40(2020)]MBC8995190.1 hypothetical protein [Pseudomonas sp. N40(2020)]